MRQNLVFITFLLVVIGLAAYVVEFVYLPSTRHIQRDHYLMGWVGYPGNRIDNTVLNSIGLTGDVPETVSPAEGITRVLTLGGSAIFNRRFTERMKAALDGNSDRRFEVLGAAYRGHTTRSSVIKYDFFSRHYDFDYVLLYAGINDTWSNNVAPDDFTNDYHHLDAWYRRNVILNNSILARDLYNKHIHRKPERRWGESAYRSAETFRANLEWIIRRALDRGSVPLLVTFATCVPPDYTMKRFLAGEVSYNNPERYDPQAIEGWGPKNKVLEGIALHNAVTRELAAECGVPLLDAAVAFGSDPEDFGDVCHFSESGTDRFAELLATFIIAQTDTGD